MATYSLLYDALMKAIKMQCFDEATFEIQLFYNFGTIVTNLILKVEK